MITKRLKITERAIANAIKNSEIDRLRDTRYSLELRFHKNRQKGSWYLINKRKLNNNGRACWELLGYWPQLKTKDLLDQLPLKIAKDISKPGSPIISFLTVGDVLYFYLEHILSSTNISKHFKRNVKSTINKHLMPMIGDVLLNKVTKTIIKEKYIWPMQSEYALSTVNRTWSILKAAFAQAERENRLSVNPIALIKLNDFIRTKIKPKDCYLQKEEFRALIKTGFNKLAVQEKMLITLQLSFGTRITETRVARWQHFDFNKMIWRIPAKNTKTKEELVLPLSDYLSKVLLWYKSQQFNEEFLFAQRNKSQPINRNQASEIYKLASNGQWSSHDCRKFMRSRLTELGIDKFISERILNHRMSNLDDTYIHSSLDKQKRNALNLYHEFLFLYGFFYFALEDSGKIQKTSQQQLSIDKH